MADELQDATPQGNATPEPTARAPEGPATPASPAPQSAAPVTPAETVAPATTGVAAGPPPQVAYTPEAPAPGTAPTAAPPAAEPEALIGSWLAEHIHHADIPYLVVVVILAFLLGSFTATNTDIWQNLATGRMLSQGKYTLGTDPFAATTTPDGLQREVIWVNQTWLYSWISYLLFDERGIVLVVLKALCAAGLACILLITRPRNRHGWAGTICVLLGILALSSAGLILRPFVISLLFLGLTMLLLKRAGVLAEPGPGDGPAQPRLLWALPPLFFLWINLDSWFIIGPMIVACCLAGLLLEVGLGKKPHFDVVQLSKVLGVAMLASLLNPHHIRAVLLMPLELSYLHGEARQFLAGEHCGRRQGPQVAA